MIPFFGTSLGAACVFFMRRKLGVLLQQALTGFAAGVMTAASVWSLLLPALEQSAPLGRRSFVPAAAGFWAGVLFLLLLDRVIRRLHRDCDRRLRQTGSRRIALLILAVVLHNVPEGMAVGAAYAGWRAGAPDVTLAGALALSVGIAIQNFPEGAIVSMPLRAEGIGKGRAFLYGVLSGAVEPVAALLTILAAGLVVPLMPYLLSFAAGAMFCVVVEELVPEMNAGDRLSAGTLLFALGFTVMMALDVALG